jgi:hypothetical protein
MSSGRRARLQRLREQALKARQHDAIEIRLAPWLQEMVDQAALPQRLLRTPRAGSARMRRAVRRSRTEPSNANHVGPRSRGPTPRATNDRAVRADQDGHDAARALSHSQPGRRARRLRRRDGLPLGFDPSGYAGAPHRRHRPLPSRAPPRLARGPRASESGATAGARPAERAQVVVGAAATH